MALPSHRSGLSHRSGGSDLFGPPSHRSFGAGAGAGAGAAPSHAYPYDGAGAGADVGPGSDDPLELEHVVGYAGQWRHSLYCHPSKDTMFVTCLGANVAVGDVTDPHQQEFLRAHDAEVSALALSASGALIASGQVGSGSSPSHEAPVVVWDFATRKQLFNQFGIRGQVTLLSFSPDEQFLAAAGSDKMLFVWDMDTGDQIYGKAQTSEVGFLAWGAVRPAGRRSAYTLCYGVGRQIFLSPMEYEARSMRHVLTPATATLPSGFERTFTAACCGPRNEVLLVGTSSGEVVVVALDSQTYRGTVPVSSNGVLTMVRAPALGVIMGSGDGTVKIFKGSDVSWQCIGEAKLNGRVVGVGVAASSVWLLAGTSRGKIYRVTVGDDEAVGTAHRRVLAAAEQETSHTRPITSVSFDGKRSDTVVTGSEDGRITVWDLSDYSAVRSFATSAVVTSVWMDELDGTVCAGCDDGALRCFEPGVESASWKLATHRGRVNTVTGTAAFLATGGDDSRVCVWSRRTRELLIQFVDHAKAVMEVVLDVASPSLLHSVGADRSVYTFDLKAERRVVGHQLNRSAVGNFTCLAQRVDSEQELITGTTDGQLLFWDCDVYDKPVGRIDLPAVVKVNDVAVSPSGQFIAVASDDSVLRLYALPSMKLVSAKVGHSGRVTALRWSPDERQIITVGSDCCTAVWNFYGLE